MDAAPEGLGGLKVTRGWAIRAGLSALVLVITLSILPLGDVMDGFRRLPFSLFFGILLLFLVGHGVACTKWWLLMERPCGFLIALRAHFAGLAANLCLPGVAGGDVVRAGIVWQHTSQGAKVAAGSFGDRLVDMLALGVVAACGVALLADGGDGQIVALILAGLILAVIATFFVVPRLVPWIVERNPGLPAKGIITKLAAALGDLGKRPGMLLTALVLSVAVQGAFVTLTIAIAETIGVEAPRAAWFFAWPLAKLLAVLPISLAGIGVREASLAALLAPFGAAAATVVAASLIWQAVLFAAGVLGALAWVFFSNGKSGTASAKLKSEGV